MSIASKPVMIATAAAVSVAAMSGYLWQIEHRPAVLEIYVFSLRSGRSMFIRTPDDRRILIDGGGNSEVIRRLTEILPFYSRRIDTVIATDTAGKNVTGLIDVMERYDVDVVYVPSITLKSLGLVAEHDRTYEAFLDSVYAHGITMEEIGRGDRLKIGHGVFLDVLFPADEDSFVYSKASAPEVLVNISYGSNSVLFLGNATVKTQKFLVSADHSGNSGSHISSDVVIIPHSASPANIHPELMNVSRPKFLVYSKVPTKAVAKKSSSTGSSTNKKELVDPFIWILKDERFNLKEVGTVRIVSDGKDVKVAPYQ